MNISEIMMVKPLNRDERQACGGGVITWDGEQHVVSEIDWSHDISDAKVLPESGTLSDRILEMVVMCDQREFDKVWSGCSTIMGRTYLMVSTGGVVTAPGEYRVTFTFREMINQ